MLDSSYRAVYNTASKTADCNKIVNWIINKLLSIQSKNKMDKTDERAERVSACLGEAWRLSRTGRQEMRLAKAGRRNDCAASVL